MNAMETQKKIIIVGAGFAGLRLAQDLEDTQYDILLIDRNNYHQFQPLMYQVATARLEPSSIAFPLRKVFQHSKNVRIRIAEVLKVDIENRVLTTSIASFEYDYLVLAFGCTTNYFGNAEIQKFAYPMKSIPESLQLRNCILQTFEDVLTAKPEDLQSLMNFVIVGGGPTGVELAGALSEMKKYVLPRDYPDKDFSKLNIYLLEGSPTVLNTMSEESQKKSCKYLKELNVIIKTNTVVEHYDGKTISLKNGEKIYSKNVIWAAGVIGNIIEGMPKESQTKGNRFVVDRRGQIKSIKNVFALGDIAYMATPKYPNGHPQVASVAVQHGKFLAKNLKLRLKNKPEIDFEYHNKGSMATIGKRKAVVDLPKFHFHGRLAWITWMLVHLMLLLSVKNKLSVFLNWTLNYFSNDSTLRILLKSVSKKC